MGTRSIGRAHPESIKIVDGLRLRLGILRGVLSDNRATQSGERHCESRDQSDENTDHRKERSAVPPRVFTQAIQSRWRTRGDRFVSKIPLEIQRKISRRRVPTRPIFFYRPNHYPIEVALKHVDELCGMHTPIRDNRRLGRLFQSKQPR